MFLIVSFPHCVQQREEVFRFALTRRYKSRIRRFVRRAWYVTGLILRSRKVRITTEPRTHVRKCLRMTLYYRLVEACSPRSYSKRCTGLRCPWLTLRDFPPVRIRMRIAAWRSHTLDGASSAGRCLLKCTSNLRLSPVSNFTRGLRTAVGCFRDSRDSGSLPHSALEGGVCVRKEKKKVGKRRRA